METYLVHYLMANEPRTVRVEADAYETRTGEVEFVRFAPDAWVATVPEVQRIEVLANREDAAE